MPIGWGIPDDMRIIFPVGLTEALVNRLGKRSKFYVFIRSIRHQLFDDAMQGELETMFSAKPRGTFPIPAAQLVLMGLLQAYDSVSDKDAIEHAIANDRWKLVLGTLGSNESPCSKKTLVFFRQRMVKHNMGEKVLAKTIALAKETKLFDPKKLGKLRVVFDSAPLRYAAHVSKIRSVGSSRKHSGCRAGSTTPCPSCSTRSR